MEPGAFKYFLYIYYLMAEQYFFITRWQFKAPLHKVWEAIYDSPSWPEWWKGIAEVKTLEEGDVNGIGSLREYTWKRVVPYSLRFTIRITEIEKYEHLKGMVYGEVEGEGEWFFEEKDGITYVQYNWDIKTTDPWMNKMAFVLRPIFKFCHRLVMRWGGKGLAKRLRSVAHG